MSRKLALSLLAACVLGGCAQARYHWGDYEESLYTRVTDASQDGSQKAFRMLEATIQAAEAAAQRVPPGVYADYAYLLYRNNRLDEAARYFRKEADLYRESRPLIESILSRIEQKGRQP